MPDTNYLLTPGPTPLPPQVMKALAQPIIHHRTPQFREILKEAEEGLQHIFQTKNDVFIFASSGTGAMEAAVCNLLSAGDKAITVEGGKFGERWTEICKSYGVETIVIAVEWGTAVDPKIIEEHLKKDSSIKAVFTTLCETSTGVTTDIQALAKVIEKTPACLVVDAISGLGAVDIKTDVWNVDVVVSGSQKGLMLPPGLAFLSTSEKAWKLIEQSKLPKYYFDLKKAKKALDSIDTAYTPAIGLVIALNESMKIIRQEGLENVFKRFATMAEVTRAAAESIGLTSLTDKSCASNAVTALNMPMGIDGAQLVKTMRDTYGVAMAGGQAHLKGKIVRIAHMGYIKETDLLVGFEILEKVLVEMGHTFQQGASVKMIKERLCSGHK
ncbi:pyridoxal-phosphate-dependent aminotransferase family protein [Candidatus Omnitrophota bacterium]